VWSEFVKASEQRTASIFGIKIIYFVYCLIGSLFNPEVDAVYPSEMLVTFYQTTRFRIPGGDTSSSTFAIFVFVIRCALYVAMQSTQL
jgi:hypothetical protein